MNKKDEDGNIIEFLKQPYDKPGSKYLLCKCGKTKCHSLVWCNSCGSKFTLDPSKITRVEVIDRYIRLNVQGKLENGQNGYNYWEAMYRYTISLGRIDLCRFEKLCKQALFEIK